MRQDGQATAGLRKGQLTVEVSAFRRNDLCASILICCASVAFHGRKKLQALSGMLSLLPLLGPNLVRDGSSRKLLCVASRSASNAAAIGAESVCKPLLLHCQFLHRCRAVRCSLRSVAVAKAIEEEPASDALAT